MTDKRDETVYVGDAETPEEMLSQHLAHENRNAQRYEWTPDEWAQFITKWANTKGWHEPRTAGEYIALFHSEISEAFESWRNDEPLMWIDESGKPQGMAIELVDALIRIFHWFGREASPDISIADALILKMDYNATRPHRHGGKKA